MSLQVDELALEGNVEARWKLWRQQVGVLVRLELRSRLTDHRSLWVYALALSPSLLMLMAWLQFQGQGSHERTIADATRSYAVIFEPLILRAIVFLGCIGIFTALFRAEILQGSLHYYFLAPLRREVLVLGKYVAGVLIAVPVFGLGAALALVIAYVPFLPPGTSHGAALHMLADHGLPYLAAVALGCCGYGAVFLFAGLVFRNPILPAAVMFAWESVNFLLPPALKAASVVHYLRALLPVPVSEGPFAMLAEPVPVPLAVAGLSAVTLVFLLASLAAARRLEIDYSTS